MMMLLKLKSHQKDKNIVIMLTDKNGKFQNTDTIMKIRRGILSMVIGLMAMGMWGQASDLKVRVTDLDGKTTVIQQVSSSSSSSCESSDFPVYQGSAKTDVDYNDLKHLMVRHDTPASDPNNYLTVELLFNDGRTGLYEMVRHIRITGKSESGNFSLKVSEMNMLEIVEKFY